MVTPLEAAERNEATEAKAAGARGTGPGPDPAPTRPTSGPLLSPEQGERLTSGLEHALVGFVDSPERSLTDADFLLDETVAQLTDALATRRRELRAGWQHRDADTERQRVLLLDYRDLVRRLLGA
ncbi:hypothetical protein [Streptomyces radicis]|uniref:hypothetical protein n=1 Tax=Streptomyces radicis TaxID=1750517 RepID=UPI0016011D0A|nr:hypothetical protein [Streptomyces radicis]